MPSNSRRPESEDSSPLVIFFWRLCGLLLLLLLLLLGSVVPWHDISRLYRFLILVTRTAMALGLVPLCEASARALTWVTGQLGLSEEVRNCKGNFSTYGERAGQVIKGFNQEGGICIGELNGCGGHLGNPYFRNQ